MSLEQEPHPNMLNAPSACAAPPPLFDSPANEIGLPIAPGPWRTEPSSLDSGAHLIMSEDGGVIGWATNRTGDLVRHKHRIDQPPAQIALHARLMAEAPAMAAMLAELMTLELFVTAQLMTGGHEPDLTLIRLAGAAKATLARVYPEGRAP